MKPFLMIAVRDEDEAVAAEYEVVRRFGEEEVAIDDVALRRPTLDDVFLTLTGHHTADETVQESA